uniref:Uncharacterized protein n=1 Tax=Lepeophtheirus salmonis TaxID=72036 RepID=A0A0K2VF55_LEPSM
MPSNNSSTFEASLVTVVIVLEVLRVVLGSDLNKLAQDIFIFLISSGLFLAFSLMSLINSSNCSGSYSSLGSC